MPMELPPIDVLATKLAGLAGAVLSVRLLKVESKMEALWMIAGGVAFSWYAAVWFSTKLGIPEGLAGFLMGLFGMGLCARIWEFIKEMPIRQIWDSLMDRFLRK